MLQTKWVLLVVGRDHIFIFHVPRDSLQRIEYYALCCSSSLIVSVVWLEVSFVTMKCSPLGAAGMDSMHSTSAVFYE
uniref:Secreted protein n=1 Tax=Haemonchus placei TaxID=6290 RepID=A0A0N4WI52_HAEPC